MIENQNAEVQAEDDIEIEITEDPVEESSVAAAPEPEGDELDRYTKSVSKRINKLNRKHRESEERAQQLERLAYEKEAELQQYRQYAVQQQQSVLQSRHPQASVLAGPMGHTYRLDQARAWIARVESGSIKRTGPEEMKHGRLIQDRNHHSFRGRFA